MIWPLKRARGSRVERQAYAWLMKMLDDPARHGAGLERWLARSPEHRTVYHRAADAVGRASDTGAMRPYLAARAGRTSRVSWRMSAVAVSVAIGIAAIVFLTSGVWRAPVSPGQQSPVVAQRFENASGERAVRLADGSKVVLFGSAELTADLQTAQRLIELRHGHALFTVAHDTARPFVVMAGSGSVTAVGTVFEVTVGRDVDVRLIEGRIRVDFAEAAGQPKTRIVSMVRGQTLTYPAERPSEPAADAVDPHRQRIRSFDDTPVADVIAATNQGTSTQIELADPTIGSQKIFAEIDISDPAAVAAKLAKLLDLSISHPMSGVIRLEVKSDRSPN
jgi:transmembrane sensor